MAPKLYKINLSAPARAVLLCAKAINVDLELIDVNLGEKQHLSQEFIKMNPQHTIPVLDDDGFILADSHAIMIYLVEKFAKESSLLPTDLQKKAIHNHRLFFDTVYLFERGAALTRLIIYEGIKQVPEKYITLLEEGFGIVEKFLTQNTWIAGDTMTIADFSFVANITTWVYFIPIKSEKYPKLAAWLKKMEALPYFEEINKPGVEQYRGIMRSVSGTS